MVKVNIHTNVPDCDVVVFSRELFFTLFVFAVVLLLRPVRADAATFNVATGLATINDGDSVCQFEEAAENINNATRIYADCIEVGTYGVNDTINLPVGVI